MNKLVEGKKGYIKKLRWHPDNKQFRFSLEPPGGWYPLGKEIIIGNVDNFENPKVISSGKFEAVGQK